MSATRRMGVTLSALAVGGPKLIAQATDAARLKRSRRVVRQLEARLPSSDGLQRNAATHAAQLAVLASITAALAERSDIEHAVREVLAETLVAAGIAKAAVLSRGTSGRLELRYAVRFADDELPGLRRLLEQGGLLERVFAQTVSVAVPSLAAGKEASLDLLTTARATSAQLVPLISGGQTLGVMLLASGDTDLTTAGSTRFARAVGKKLAQSLSLAEASAGTLASEQRYRTLMEKAPDAISILTLDGIVREVNRSWEEMFGHSAAEAVGSHIGAFASPGHEGGNLQSFHQMVAANIRGSAPRALRRADGSEMLMEFNLSTIEVGGETLVLSIGRDVTAQVQAQSQLMVADRMVSIGMLAAGVAHEINNPLTAVAGNLELAGADLERLRPAAGGTAEFELVISELAQAREAAERIRLIVRDLKLFSRADEERTQPVDLHRVLDSSLRMASNEIRHRARVIKEYGEVPPVQANEARLGQVFLNLLVNAAQALPAGHADVHEIRVRTRSENRGVAIEIQDSGAGIAPDILKRLFTPFLTTKPKGVGTGLGLTICHRIVTALQGTIVVTSEVGRGTTFRVWLPEGAPVEARPPSQSAPALSAARRGRVMVVDDEPMIARLLERVLEVDHEVVASTSAREAIDRLAAGEEFDVIVCDLMMPEITGIDFHAALAARWPAAAANIIFLTGGAFTPEARAFIDSVPNAVLEKPPDMRTLRVLVNDRMKERARIS